MTEANGAHIIAWADDWEVSGAMDPLKRPQLGPWLNDHKGPYDGIAGAAVDRIGRNVRDVLNTAYTIHEKGQILLTADHSGPWNLDDSQQETDLLVRALGAQLEHRETRKRSNESRVSSRQRGRVSALPSYGYMHVRPVPNQPVASTVFNPIPCKEIRKVARRILLDQTGEITPNSERVRLNREGVLTPRDELLKLYGKEPRGGIWSENTLKRILTSKAALGYLMHKHEPVLDDTGKPIKVAPELWDYPTHLALVEKCKPKTEQRNPEKRGRASQGKSLLSRRIKCGNCGNKLRADRGAGYICNARHLGIAPQCQPSPNIRMHIADREVENWFLKEFGHGEIMEKVYDPGTNYAAQIAELKASRARLRKDREAGLYEDDDDYDWYVSRYSQLGTEINQLRTKKERPPMVRLVPTGKTVRQKWDETQHLSEKRELLSEFGVGVILYDRSATPRLKISAENPYASIFTQSTAT